MFLQRSVLQWILLWPLRAQTRGCFSTLRQPRPCITVWQRSPQLQTERVLQSSPSPHSSHQPKSAGSRTLSSSQWAEVMDADGYDFSLSFLSCFFFTCVKSVAFRDNWALFFLCNSFPPWTHAFGNHPLRFTLPELLWRIWEVRWRFNSAALKYCLHSGRVEALSLTLVLSRRVSKKLQKNKASTRRLLCLEKKKKLPSHQWHRHKNRNANKCINYLTLYDSNHVGLDRSERKALPRYNAAQGA